MQCIRRWELWSRLSSAFGHSRDSKDFNHDCLGHFGLEAEDVTDLALITARPEVLLGIDTDQLNADAYFVSATHRGTFDYRINVQFSADLWHRLVRSFVTHHGLSRDHSQPTHTAEFGDQRLG